MAKINPILEELLAVEFLIARMENKPLLIEYKYRKYLKYTREFPRQYNQKMQSIIMNNYARWKIKSLKEIK